MYLVSANIEGLLASGSSIAGNIGEATYLIILTLLGITLQNYNLGIAYSAQNLHQTTPGFSWHQSETMTCVKCGRLLGRKVLLGDAVQSHMVLFDLW